MDPPKGSGLESDAMPGIRQNSLLNQVSESYGVLLVIVVIYLKRALSTHE